MAVYIVTGIPGSGKTYWCVTHILRKYFSFDRVLQEYIPRSDFTIYSNIDSLRLDHVVLPEVLKDVPKETFFTVEYQKELLVKHHRIIYFIDEAQFLFPTKFSDNDVLFFFEYHRHLGIDIYLLCPDAGDLPRRMRTLAEYVLKASARSLRFVNEFRFHKVVEGMRTGNIMLRFDKRVFALYRSMSMSEGVKIKRVATKYLVALCLLLLLVPLCFYGAIHWFFGGHHEIKKKPSGGVAGVESPKPAMAGVSVSASAASLASPLGPKVPDPADFFAHYQQVRLVGSASGKLVVYGSDDARIYTPEELVVLRPVMVVIGDKVFVPRMVERGQATGEGRTGAEAESRVLPFSASAISGAVSPVSPEPGGKSYIIPASGPKHKPGVYVFEGEKEPAGSAPLHAEGR